MDKVLIVSSSNKGIEMLSSLLFDADFTQITIAKDAKSAKKIQTDFDIIVINSPLSDEFGDSLAKEMVFKKSSGVILIVKSEQLKEIQDKVEADGVFVLQKPLSKNVFCQSVKLAKATTCRLCALKEQNEILQCKIDDMKLINRAKCTLIEYLKMNENQAHKYIEKQAMDLRIPKREVAKNILNTYEA